MIHGVSFHRYIYMSALAILRPNSLYIYFSDQPKPVGGALAKTAVLDMEIISEDDLAASITKFVPANTHTFVQTVLVLSDELCFTQEVTDPSKREDVEAKLIDNTPFSHVSTISLVVKNKQYVMAVNQDYYESVARVLGLRGYTISLVVPWSLLVYRDMTKGEIDMVTVKRVIDAISDLRVSAFPFMAEKKEKIVPTVLSTVKQKRKISWGWYVFCAVAFLYALGMYWFFMRAG